jgi:uncharacterized membrane-anchored protein
MSGQWSYTVDGQAYKCALGNNSSQVVLEKAMSILVIVVLCWLLLLFVQVNFLPWSGKK